MRKQDIDISISPTGEVSFTIKGVKGPACLDETRFLEEAIGVVTEREKTADFYQGGPASSVRQWSGDGEGD